MCVGMVDVVAVKEWFQKEKKRLEDEIREVRASVNGRNSK